MNVAESRATDVAVRAGTGPHHVAGQSTSSRHPVLGALGIVTVLVAAALGGPWGLRERLVDRFSSNEVAAPAPQWQGVVTLRGTGTRDAPAFAIPGGTARWRLRWTCQGAHLVVTAAGAAGPLVDAICPGGDARPGTGIGKVDLRVVADGSWQLDVERQER